jgi:hypothetical protein
MPGMGGMPGNLLGGTSIGGLQGNIMGGIGGM